jgi:hypothetical protein
MRAIAWLGVVLMGICAITAEAGEGKEKKKDRQGAAADASSATQGPATDGKGTSKDKSGSEEKAKDKKDRKDAKDADANGDKSGSDSAKAEREAAEAKEAGGDESELTTLTQTLGLSDQQKKEIGKEFEKYRARLAEIKGLPDKSPNEKLLKGPQRRALREDLAKWIKGNVSPGQAQKLDAYEKKRTKDLFDEHVNNRVANLTEALHLNENQQSKVREIYDVQLRGVQNAADELYAASQKAGASVGDLEKALEAKRDAMKKAIEGVLKPDQVELYKKMDP